MGVGAFDRFFCTLFIKDSGLQVKISWRFSIGLASALASALLSFSAVAKDPTSQLLRSQELGGWKLLFDGETLEGWRNYQKADVSGGWEVVDGALTLQSEGAGDIVTVDTYKDFELTLEYKVSEGGDSGLLFHVTEELPKAWQSGPEVQIIDDKQSDEREKSGWLFGMYKPDGNFTSTRPAGDWNHLYLRVTKNNSEIAINGRRYFSFSLADKRWNEHAGRSPFAKFPGFGLAGEGHIGIRDQGGKVAFRKIMIREMTDGHPPQAPIDGKLDVKQVPAFPELTWEGWEAMDDDGNAGEPFRIIELTYAPDESKRLYAVNQIGVVFAFENKPGAQKAKRFLDLRDRVSRWSDQGRNEQGLLGLAFHPNFKSNREFFVYYTNRKNNHVRVSRFRSSKEDPFKADPTSEEVLLDEFHPHLNHNGGSIEFGPDGYLYVSIGDGGSGHDPDALGQNRSQLMASIIRIDVDQRTNDLRYGIPDDNPFVSVKGARPEIFAHGFRNPWRIAFDRVTGRLWCGDVGQDLHEEVNVVTKGGNYGWSDREGNYIFGNRASVDGVSEPIAPVWGYDHAIGKSITGGRVYNQDRLPQLKGKYLYADYVSGAIWALTYDPASGQATHNQEITDKGLPVLAFGEGADGEIYCLKESRRGEFIFRFEPSN